MKHWLRTLVSMLLLLAIVFTFGACNKEDEPPQTPEPLGAKALHNKKVIIIGNSHTYVGGMVGTVSQDKMEISDRDHDKGYFYHLCKENGADVEVLNWTFGNHSLKDLFSGNCQANRKCGNGADHFSPLTDNNFDYVIFQNGATNGD